MKVILTGWFAVRPPAVAKQRGSGDFGRCIRSVRNAAAIKSLVGRTVSLHTGR